MVCSSCVRSLVVQAGTFAKRVRINNTRKSLLAVPSISYSPIRQFKTFTVMMVDTGSVSRSAGSLVDMMPEKDDDGRFASGGWKSEDGRLSCGYSSFRGKRVTMEDFYDIKTLKIGGHSVCLFGIFDGHGSSRAAEYLKEHIFNNLMKHSNFLYWRQIGYK